MTTTADVLTRARRYVMGSRRDLVTTVTTAVDNDDVSLVVASASGIAAQTLIEVDAEQMLVTAVATLTLTVIRGYNGTIEASHAIGALVIVNPSITLLDLTDAANAELHSLSTPMNGLFRVTWTDISSGTGKDGYDLDAPAGFLDVLRVSVRPSSQLGWTPIPSGEYRVIRDAPTTDFASGVGIVFIGGFRGTGLTTRVWMKVAFNDLSGDLAEDVPAATGIHQEAVDIVSMGAAIRAVEGREIARVVPNGVGDTRRASEVPMGNALQAPSSLRRSRNERIAEEASRLKQQWGRT